MSIAMAQTMATKYTGNPKYVLTCIDLLPAWSPNHVIQLLDATKLLDHKNNQEDGNASAKRNEDGSRVDNISEQVQRKFLSNNS